MKKFFCLFAALALLVGVTACTNDSFSFEYNFSITGCATGDVDVTFPGGELALKGDSYLEFTCGSVPESEAVEGNFSLVTVKELQESGKSNYRHVADVFLTDYEDAFQASATSADGTYYLHVIGFVKEKLTGLELQIDKVLTNEEPAPEAGEE